MPIRFCFFCSSSKNDSAISEAWTDKDKIDLDIIIAQCENVFNFKSAKLENPSKFAFFHLMGFHTIYSLTKAASSSPFIKTKQLSNLNTFMMAETIAAKKALFLSDCKNYIKQYLLSENIEDPMLSAFEPIMEYCAQKIDEPFLSILNEKKSKYRYGQLKIIGETITQLVHISMEIKTFITAKTTEKTLKAIEQRITKFADLGSLNPGALDPQKEIQEVLSKTTANLKSCNSETISQVSYTTAC